MTAAPQAPPLSFSSIDDAIRAVRGQGMRLSTARRLVLEALFAAQGPVSAAHLSRTVALDESSVYRNLEVLERHGLIRHVHLGHGPGLYALVGRHEVEYLYCERCARVTSAAPDQLDALREQIRDQFGYEARFTHFAIVGLCEQCAEPEPSSAGCDETPAPALQSHHGSAATVGEVTHEHAHSHGDLIHSHPHADRREHEH